MKNRISFAFLSIALAGFIFFPFNSFAQQKSPDQAKGKKTITITVTKETDGNTTVIDTTIVTDGDFDANAILEEKNVKSDMPGAGGNIEKRIIIRQPDSKKSSWSESDGNSTDTIIINDGQVFSFNEHSDMPAPHSPHGKMPFDFNFKMPGDFDHMQGPQFEEMLEGMARAFGLENVMPFGEMKQMVVKKKRNGKKVIITFEDRDENRPDPGQEVKKQQKKVIIHKNGEQGMSPQNEERVFIEGQPGENIVIHKKIIKTENGDQVIINAEVEQPKSSKKEKKVIIITEEGTK